MNRLKKLFCATVILALMVFVHLLEKINSFRWDLFGNKELNISVYVEDLLTSASASKYISNSIINLTIGTSLVAAGFPPDTEECFLPPRSSEKFPEVDPSFLKTEEGKDFKTILSYFSTYPYDFYFGYGWKPFATCGKEKRCFMTAHRDALPFTSFDALLFHFRGLSVEKLPEERSPHQRWIFVEMEPPTKSSRNPQDYEGVFNWTMTYRRDSDIFGIYGLVYNKSTCREKNFTHQRKGPSLESVMKSKRKMAAWLVSACYTPSRRESYVKGLQKYIQVDIYGGCGSFFCHKSNRPKCYELFEKDYKFYLSFENSFCTDYISEKFYNILSYYIVPVVRGSGDYAAMAPPHSYINAEDFKSEKELAEYLKFLDRNHSAYMEYFKWKKDYFVLNQYNSQVSKYNFCKLCAKLHENSEAKTYWNLQDWFMRKAKC